MSSPRIPIKLDSEHVRVDSRALFRIAPWVLGAVGLGLLALAWVLGSGEARRPFFFSYLTAFMFWLSIALGALFFVIVQFATKAGWSVVVRRLAEHATTTLWLFAVLFVPIALGLHDLFHWSHADAVAIDPILREKAPYLNATFFYLRACGYFVVWLLVASYFHRQSVAQDKDGDPARTERLQRFSGPALVLFALTITFASFDWMMSLDPHWYSTMYGVYYFSSSLVAIFAFLPLAAIALRALGLLRDVITYEHYHDMGKLLFAFVVFWSYIAFSQFMLYWYANIPEETLWYAHRFHGSWLTLSVVLAVGHFALPFFFLMTRLTKRNHLALLIGAAWMLAMHYLDIYWLIMPTVFPQSPRFGMVDLTLLLGMGCLFDAVFLTQLRRHALLPVRDPRLAESLAFENF